MWALAIILPLAVCATHWTYNAIAKDLNMHPAFIFYAEVGMLLAILSGSIAWLVKLQKIEPSAGPVNWNGMKVELIYGAMVMSAVEGLLMSCYLLGPVEGNACDYHSGLKIGAACTVLWLFMFIWIVAKNAKPKRPAKHHRPVHRPSRLHGE